MQHHRVAAAVHDRDSDIPVVFYGLCLSRCHHLFGLIERDRSAIVTDTFVNRHHSLRFVGASQHAINVSKPLRQSDFAERDLWNVGATRTAYSGLLLAARITLLYFSVSAVQYAPNSAGLTIVGLIVNSARRASILSSASPALVSRLSFSMIAVGVPRGTPMPVHVSVS